MQDADETQLPEQQQLQAVFNETTPEAQGLITIKSQRESWVSVVTPLATLSLLGAAAAVASNPVLSTMVGLSKRRKRRDAQPMHQIQVLEKYLSKVPDFKLQSVKINSWLWNISHAQVEDQETQQEKLMATYLSCSGFTSSSNFCLDRVICEYSIQTKRMDSLEKDVISMYVDQLIRLVGIRQFHYTNIFFLFEFFSVLFNIMTNNYVSKDFKERLRRAAKRGRNRARCNQYRCDQLT